MPDLISDLDAILTRIEEEQKKTEEQTAQIESQVKALRLVKAGIEQADRKMQEASTEFQSATAQMVLKVQQTLEAHRKALMTPWYRKGSFAAVILTAVTFSLLGVAVAAERIGTHSGIPAWTIWNYVFGT